jgi:hypothetical protein
VGQTEKTAIGLDEEHGDAVGYGHDEQEIVPGRDYGIGVTDQVDAFGERSVLNDNRVAMDLAASDDSLEFDRSLQLHPALGTGMRIGHRWRNLEIGIG